MNVGSRKGKLLFGLHSFEQKPTVFFEKTVGKSKLCFRNLKISTFDYCYNKQGGKVYGSYVRKRSR